MFRKVRPEWRRQKQADRISLKNGEILWAGGKRYTLCLSPPILEEVRRVLAYPRLQRYGYTEQDVEAFVEALRAASHLVRRLPRLRVILEDPADDVVLATAVAAQAECIVSKDEHLQRLREYQGICILSTDDFLKLLGEG